MDVRLVPFLDFVFGDKRKDRKNAEAIREQETKDYDPSKDRYKKFRESLARYEAGTISESDFLNFYKSVSVNKSSGYQILSRNYLDSKEDNALTWVGYKPAFAVIGGVKVKTSWYLQTSEANRTRLVFLNLRKEPFGPRRQKAILSFLQAAEPGSAGAGILNVQAATLLTSSRIDASTMSLLEERGAKLKSIFDNL